MFFFLMWGTKIDQEVVGGVADICPYCCELRFFHVIDHYRVDHVYYISLGRGTFAARTRRCLGCHRLMAFDETRYAGPVAPAMFHAATMEDVLLRTNPALHHRIVELDRLEAMACRTPYREQASDPMMLECVRWLRWLSSVAKNDEAINRIAAWTTLTDQEKYDLVGSLRRVGGEVRAKM